MKAPLTCIVLFFSFSLAAQWSGNPAVADNKVCTAGNQQINHLVVPDNANGIITAWRDSRPGSDGTDIYIERISNTGNPLWSSSPGFNGIVVSNAAGDQDMAALLADGAGGAFVLWTDGPEDDRDIYVQQFNSSGVAQWLPATGVVVCNAAEGRDNLKMIADGAGGVIVSWEDYREAGIIKAYAQRINSSGGAQWTPNGIKLSTGVNHDAPIGIVPDGSGGAIIFYLDTRNNIPPAGDIETLTNIDIYAQRLNSDGIAQWDVLNNGVAICTETNNQNVNDQFDFYKHCVSDGSGGAILVWSDFRNDPGNGSSEGDEVNADFYAQRVNGSGVVQWATDGVVVCNAGRKQSNMNVISDGAGGIIVVWDDHRNIFFPEVYIQRFNSSGAAQWTPANGIQLNPSGFGAQFPDIIADNNGGAIITWTDYRGGNDIYGQRINLATGTVYWAAGGVPVCTQSNSQQFPRLASSGGGAIIVWEDGRNSATSNTDLYAALLTSMGTLPLVWGTVSATVHNNDVLVQWQTLSESNTLNFIVERSRDGINYTAIGTVPAQGNSSTTIQYRLADKKITGEGRLYYRVKQVDADGRSSYSKTVSVAIAPTSSLQVLRNPVKDVLQLRYTAASDMTLTIKIITSTGQAIMNIQKQVTRGRNDLVIPFNKPANGNYRVQVIGKEHNESILVIKN